MGLIQTGAVLFSWMLALSVIQAQRVDPQTIVDAHYPTSRLEPEEASDRRSCYKVMAFAADGAPSRIVAGYTDTVEAVLRVLRRNPSGTFDVSFESPASLGLLAIECTLTLADIDGDGSEDVFFELSNEKGTDGWLFRAVQSTLENITPTSGTPDHIDTELQGPLLVDLYHDGSLQIVTAGSKPEPDGGRVTALPEIYRFSGSGMVLDSSVLFVREFQPSLPAFLKIASFNLQEGGTGPYVLRITNGTRGGQKRAGSISLSINGQQLPGTAAFGTKTEFLDVPINLPLKDENKLKIAMTGASDAIVLVVIRSQSQ